jgi:hypothetical protein
MSILHNSSKKVGQIHCYSKNFAILTNIIARSVDVTRQLGIGVIEVNSFENNP